MNINAKRLNSKLLDLTEFNQIDSYLDYYYQRHCTFRRFIFLFKVLYGVYFSKMQTKLNENINVKRIREEKKKTTTMLCERY